MQEPQIKEFENLNRDLELLNQNNEDFKEQKQTKLKAQPSTEKDSTSESEFSDKQNSEETKIKNGASQLYILQVKDLSQLINDESTQLSKIESEYNFQEINSEINTYKSKIDLLTSEVQQQKQNFLQEQERNYLIVQENLKLKEDYAQIEKKLIENQGLNEHDKKENQQIETISGQDKEIKRLTNELSKLESINFQITSQLTEQQSEKVKQVEINYKLEQQIETLDNQLKEQTSNLVSVKQQLQVQETENLQLKAQQTNYQQDIEQKTQEFAHQSELTKQEIKKMKQTFSERENQLESNNEELRNKLNAQEQELKNQTTLMEQLTEQQNTLLNQLKVKEQKIEIETQKQNNEMELKNKSNEILKISEDLVQFKQLNSQQQHQLEQLQQQQDDISKSKQELKQKMENENNKLEQIIESLKNELVKKTNENELVKTQLTNQEILVKQSQELIQGFNEKNDQLKEANSELLTQLTAAKENEIQINIQTMELTKNLEELQNKSSLIQNELAKKENENQSLIKQQQDHSSKLVLLNQKLEQEQQQTIQLQKNFAHKEKQLKAENQELINKLSQIEYDKQDNQKMKLKKQAKDLNKTLQNKESQLLQLVNQYDQLQIENKKLRQNLFTSLQDSQKIKTDLESLKQKESQQIILFQNLNSENIALKTDIQVLKSTNSQLESQVQQLNSQLINLNEINAQKQDLEKNNQNQLNKNQKNQLEELECQNKNLQEMIKKQEGLSTQLQHQIDQKNGELQNLQDKYQQEKNELEQKQQQQYEQLQNQLKSKDLELLNHKEYIEVQNQQIITLKNEKDSQEKNLIEKDAQLKINLLELTQSTQEFEKLNKNMLELKEEIVKINEIEQKKNLEIVSQQSNIKELQDQLSQVQVNLTQKQKDLDNLQNELTTSQCKSNEKTESIRKLETEKYELTTEGINYKIQILKISSNNPQQPQLQENDNTKYDLQSKIRHLETQLYEHQIKSFLQEQEIVKLKQIISENEKLKIDLQDSNNQIQQLNMKLESQKKENDAFDKRNKELEQENGELKQSLNQQQIIFKSMNEKLQQDLSEHIKIQQEKENDKLKKQLEKLDFDYQMQKLQSELQVTTLEQKIKQQTYQLEDLRKPQKENQVQQINEIQSVKNQLLNEQEVIKTLQSEFQKSQSLTQKLNQNNQKLEEQIKNLEIVNQNLNNLILEKEQIVQQLSQKVENLKEESKGFKDQLHKTIEELRDAQFENNRNVEEINSTNRQLTTMTQKFEVYQKLCENLKKQESFMLLQVCQKENANLKAECARFKQLTNSVSQNPYPSKLYNQCVNLSKQLIEYSIDTQEFLQKVEQIHQEMCKMPIALLLGQSESSKQQLIQNLQMKQNIQLYEKKLIEHLENNIIDTDQFEFEDVDERERQITQYKRIFRQNPNKFNALWITVKFERTDIMKKSIMEVYKHVHKLKIPISLIVTDFHLSENEEKDKEDLRQKFKIYKPKQIVFVGQDSNLSQLIQDLKQTLPETTPNQQYPLQREDTLFEDENEEESQRMMQQLQNQFVY